MELKKSVKGRQRESKIIAITFDWNLNHFIGVIIGFRLFCVSENLTENMSDIIQISNTIIVFRFTIPLTNDNSKLSIIYSITMIEFNYLLMVFNDFFRDFKKDRIQM